MISLSLSTSFPPSHSSPGNFSFFQDYNAFDNAVELENLEQFLKL